MTSNPLERMELNKSKFTKTEIEVYDILKNNIHDLLHGPVTEFASSHGISQASITRFCKKLGYKGFNDFRFDLYRYQKQELDGSYEQNSSLLSMYSRLILQMESAISPEQVTELAERIVKAKKVVLSGVNKSFLPAKMLQLNLMRLSILATTMTFDEWGMCKNFLNKDDLLIIFSARLKYKELSQYIVNQQPAALALITMTDKTPFKNKSDMFFWLPSAENQNYPLYLENEVPFLIFADLLTSYVAKNI